MGIRLWEKTKKQNKILRLFGVLSAVAVIGISGMSVRAALENEKSTQTRSVNVQDSQIEASTLVIGSHLIHINGLTDELYTVAVESANEFNQHQMYYKSELANGSWFEISEAVSIADITTAGNPVSKSVIEALEFTHKTGANGITTDLRNGQTVSVFDINNPYDLNALEELEPLRLQYQILQEKTDKNESDEIYLKMIQAFFEKDIRSDQTKECDTSLIGLESYKGGLYSREKPSMWTEKTENIMKNWLRLRHRLFPYIYTMNYRNHVDLEPLVQPMYYAYPKKSAAYEAKNQFMFGSELMVAPITKPNNKLTQMGSVNAWFPAGEWFDFFSGLHYTSKAGRTLSFHRKINDYPVFAKAGAIVPMQNTFALEPGIDLKVVIFPGASNQFALYEDAGDGSEFENGEFTKTDMSLEWSANPVFTVKPANGALSLLPNTRNYSFVLRGFNANISVKALVDGNEIASDCTYDADTHSVVLKLSADVTSEIKLMISGNALITDNGDVVARITNLLQKAHLHTDLKIGVMDIVKDANIPLNRKLVAINWKCARDIEYNDLIDTLKEQLILVEE